MSSTQDIEIAAGASVTAAATATASSIPMVSSGLTWLATNIGATSTAAHFGSSITIALLGGAPVLAPVVAVAGAIYAIARLFEETEQ